MKHDKEAIEIITSFVEGRMKMDDFIYQFRNNNLVKKNFSNYPNKPHKSECGYDYLGFLETQDIKTRGGALNVFGFMEEFLRLNNYPFVSTDKYSKEFRFLLKTQPHWLDVIDETFLQKEILSLMPKEFSESKQIAWCKERIKKLFKFDTKPPRWIQSAEWPIINGKPLVFKSQSKEHKDDERVNFYFYDSDTKKEVVVTQIY